MKSIAPKILLAAFAVLITKSAPAMDDAAIDTLASKMVGVLNHRVIPLDRELYTFHYEMDLGGLLPKTVSEIRTRLQGTPERFFNHNLFNSDVQGLGLYLAVDPTSSRSFGSTAPLLFVVPLKKGTRLLDLKSQGSLDESNGLREIAETSNCSSVVSFGDAEGATSFFRDSLNPDCRKIIARAYSQMGVEGILYNYMSDSFARGCRSRSDAINLLSSNAIKTEDLGLFTNEIKVGRRTLARYVGQIYRSAKRDFNTRFNDALYGSTFAMPDSINNLQVFDRAARAWRKRNLLRCGELWSIEKTPSGHVDIDAKLKESFSDSELQDAIITWFKAYRSKVDHNEGNFSTLVRMNKFEELSYLASGYPQDFSKFEIWKNAVDARFNLQSGESGLRDRTSAALLDEKVLPSVDSTIIGSGLEKQWIKDTNQPGLYGAKLKSNGYGPRMIRIKLAELLSMYGYPPILTEELPLDPSANYTDLLRQNKEISLKVLRDCAALINEPSSTKESIQAGPCGVRPIPTLTK